MWLCPPESFHTRTARSPIRLWYAVQQYVQTRSLVWWQHNPAGRQQEQREESTTTQRSIHITHLRFCYQSPDQDTVRERCKLSCKRRLKFSGTAGERVSTGHRTQLAESTKYCNCRFLRQRWGYQDTNAIVAKPFEVRTIIASFSTFTRAGCGVATCSQPARAAGCFKRRGLEGGKAGNK